MKPQYKVYREASIFYFNAPFFWCSLFFKNISTPRLEPTNGKQCCLPPLSFKISLKDTSFHISLNSLGFYLSPECLLNFLWLVYSTMCGKIFQFMVFMFRENALNLCIFAHAPVPHSKLQVEFFENLFPPNTKGVEETMICFIKIQSENMEMTWNIRLFICCMICNFAKRDGPTVL